jgi:hypothetical protein
MNRLQKQLLCWTALISAAHLFGDGTVTNIVPRSQSFNAARQMIGWNNPEWGINRYPQDDYYASMNITFEYTRTFRDKRLAECLFGNDLTCQNRLCAGCGVCEDGPGINITGSDVTDRGPNDWLADYFGLPRDFESTVFFNPSISNYILDFSFYAGLDAWIDGLYFRIHGPFVHTKWNLNAEESIATNGSTGYFTGYFSSSAVPITNLNSNFLAYANGCTPLINNDFSGQPSDIPLYPITWQPLCCSKISNGCDALSRNGFAELRMVLGYNFLNDADEQYHAGLGVYIAAPTGTSVGDQDCGGKGRYLFEPIVGNGKHWELGAQVTAHHIWWNNQDDTKSLGVYLEANATHLFNARQTRCFDLYSAGSNSRYMLAEYLAGGIRNTYEGGIEGMAIIPPIITPTQDPLGLIFGNEYAPVANLTQRSVKSSIAVQGDIAISLAYQSGNFQWDVGYNFWGRTCENICIDECCPMQVGNWALKGDQRVYGFSDAGPSATAVRVPVTDSQATINQGSNMANGVDYLGDNPTNPVNFYADNSIILTPFVTILPISLSHNSIYASQIPVFIQESDFDLTGTRGTSNKVFTNFNWKWDPSDEYNWTPYVSLGGEVEFGTTGDNCRECQSSCDSGCGSNGDSCNTAPAAPCNVFARRAPVPTNCVDCAISQWGIWLKIGASYN